MPARTLLAALALLGPALAQNSLYSDGGCRITEFGPEVNVTCTCRQTLQQTAGSLPIDHLTIVGCFSDGRSPSETSRVSFVEARPAVSSDFLLLQVRSLNISQASLALEPVQNHPAAARHPLQRMQIELSTLPEGLPDGALQGLASLQHVSLLFVQMDRVDQSALSDLPQLQSLVAIGCTVNFVDRRSLVRTPRLRRLHLASSSFRFLRSDAIIMEDDDEDEGDYDNDEDDDMDDTSPTDNSTELVTEPDPNTAYVLFANNSVVSMSAGAIQVGATTQLIVSGNGIGEMYPGALNVTLRPAGRRPLLQFTHNDIGDMRRNALAVTNEAAVPADLLLGANSLESNALSSWVVQLRGLFQRRRVAGLPPGQYDCSCCQCPSTRRLIDLALRGKPDQLETQTFVAALATARCLKEPERTFLEFVDGCQPDTNLTARVHKLLPVTGMPSNARLPSAVPLLLLLLLPLPVALPAAGYS